MHQVSHGFTTCPHPSGAGCELLTTDEPVQGSLLRQCSRKFLRRFNLTVGRACQCAERAKSMSGLQHLSTHNSSDAFLESRQHDPMLWEDPAVQPPVQGCQRNIYDSKTLPNDDKRRHCPMCFKHFQARLVNPLGGQQESRVTRFKPPSNEQLGAPGCSRCTRYRKLRSHLRSLMKPKASRSSSATI